MSLHKPLLALASGLVGLIVLEFVAGPFLMPRGLQDAPDVNAVGSDSPQDLSIKRPPISDFAEVVLRPLFAPSRRPYTPKDQKLATSEAKPETFDLVGVIISPIGRVALLRPRANSEVLRVTEGQRVAGWEVRTIKSTEVVLARGSDDEVLKIDNAAMESAGDEPSRSGQGPDQQSVPASDQESSSTDSLTEE